MDETARSHLYLDYAASAPLRSEALEAEADYDRSPFAGANPNSLHTLGRRAARALDGARRDITSALGGGFRPQDLAFTSGGTESNNLALHGMAEGARGRDRRRRRIVISAIEHDSEIDVAPSLRDEGFTVTLVRPGADGRVSPDALDAVLADDVALVSIMSANNETGIVQPLAELAAASHEAGALMHTDAAQAFGKIPLALEDVDGVSLSAHKIGGPVGVGALVLRSRCPFRPREFGGGQEGGRRPGTQDVRGALAFAAVARFCSDGLEARRLKVEGRAQVLYDRLCAPKTGILPTTTARLDENRLPGIVSVMTRRLDSPTLVLRLDQAGFEVSAGSACSSASLDASHVLLAMGIPREVALGSLRISFDERVGTDELDRFAQELLRIVSSAR